MASDAATTLPELEPATPEAAATSGRRSRSAAGQRGPQPRLDAALLGFVVGPELSRETRIVWEDWLRLLASAALLGITLELLTFPLDYYSGFVLEHRYQLSNQSLAGWLWKRLKASTSAALLAWYWSATKPTSSSGWRGHGGGCGRPPAGCSSRWCWGDCSPS